MKPNGYHPNTVYQNESNSNSNLYLNENHNIQNHNITLVQQQNYRFNSLKQQRRQLEIADFNCICEIQSSKKFYLKQTENGLKWDETPPNENQYEWTSNYFGVHNLKKLKKRLLSNNINNDGLLRLIKMFNDSKIEIDEFECIRVEKGNKKYYLCFGANQQLKWENKHPQVKVNHTRMTFGDEIDHLKKYSTHHRLIKPEIKREIKREIKPLILSGINVNKLMNEQFKILLKNSKNFKLQIDQYDCITTVRRNERIYLIKSENSIEWKKKHPKCRQTHWVIQFFGTEIYSLEKYHNPIINVGDCQNGYGLSQDNNNETTQKCQENNNNKNNNNNNNKNDKKWACSACTFENNDQLLACGICGTTRKDVKYCYICNKCQIYYIHFV